jgi:hypothetical protein
VVGPTARVYWFKLLSVTEFTVEVVSFHPTTTMFRFPAVCATAYVTGTDAVGVRGVAAATWTKLIGPPPVLEV